MRRYISVVIMALLLNFLFVSEAQAHSVVVSSNPEDGETVEEELSAVSMTFDTSIQQEEDIYLEDSEGERIEPEEVTIDNDTVEVSLSEPLSSGEYTIFWEVYGADGHLVNGEIEFSVDAPEAGAEDDSANTEIQEDEAASSNEESGGMATSTIVFIVGIAIVGIGVIVFFTRRRK